MAEKDDSLFLMIVGAIAVLVVMASPILGLIALFNILVLN